MEVRALFMFIVPSLNARLKKNLEGFIFASPSTKSIQTHNSKLYYTGCRKNGQEAPL
jgi:hypothetical protein